MLRTKIVATLGPASDEPGVLGRMIGSGADVMRLNASHAAIPELGRLLAAVRTAADRAGRHIGVMLDLGGPKLRVGEMSPDTVLRAGDEFTLTVGDVPGDATRAAVSWAGLPADVAVGDRIMLDDGAIELAVLRTTAEEIVTVVKSGGPLSSRKGVNVPGVRLSLDAVTDKDLADLAWALDSGVDLVAQSFVRGPADVERLRAAMGERRVPIVAKIEKHEAVDSLPEIVAVADAVMVARGDLGVETAPEQVPVIQRELVMECLAAGKPVIVATQMLESMVHAARPTRAEASDVATAVFEGADAVMLSAETAVGEHPVESVETMARVISAAEAAGDGGSGSVRPAGGDVTAAVSAAVVELASRLPIAAIVTATESGVTARMIASRRPRVPIVAMTPDAAVARQLALAWGVDPNVVGSTPDVEAMAREAAALVRARGLARQGDLIALTGGVALNRPGTTDFVRVLHV